jgi:hypothetical protein
MGRRKSRVSGVGERHSTRVLSQKGKVNRSPSRTVLIGERQAQARWKVGGGSTEDRHNKTNINGKVILGSTSMYERRLARPSIVALSTTDYWAKTLGIATTVL